MNYLIIGGSKSGKSQIGEDLSLALNKDKVLYIATMKPFDKEDELRIENHIRRRENSNFITIEKHRNLLEIINEIKENDTILLDSLTSLLTNEMFQGNLINKEPYAKIVTELEFLMRKAKNTIVVSDYIFNDSITYDEITENYKKQLSLLNRHMAKICDNVMECSYGNVKLHKVK